MTKGESMAACTRWMDGDDNSLLVEAMKMNKVINVAKDCGFFDIQINIDNETLTNMMNDEVENRTTARILVKTM